MFPRNQQDTGPQTITVHIPALPALGAEQKDNSEKEAQHAGALRKPVEEKYEGRVPPVPSASGERKRPLPFVTLYSPHTSVGLRNQKNVYSLA